MTRTLQRWASVVALALALVGCAASLDEPTLVKTPRILAILADHPEVAPGQDVQLRVLAVDPLGMGRELHYSFRTCFDPAAFFGAPTSNGTGGMMAMSGLCTPRSTPSTSEQGVMPGDFTTQIINVIGTLAPTAQFDPAALLARVLPTSGGPVTVEVEVSTPDPTTGDEVVLVSGRRSIGITTREHPTTNPPFIYFRVRTEAPEQDRMADPVEVAYIGGTDPAHPFDCVPWLSAPATAIASTSDAIADPAHPHEHAPNHVSLAPADDPSTWEESFPFFDYTGSLNTGYEGAYYSWYSTASLPDHRDQVHSSLHTETTQGPSHGAPPSAIDDTIRDNTWDVPREPGDYDLWLIVRDGHLGQLACHFTIAVTAAP
jgi:hypothetical protein